MADSGRKFVASYSGGKDSALALYRAIRRGMIPVGLITTYNTNLDRSWFHGIPAPLLAQLSGCLGIPLTPIPTAGGDYEACFVRELKRQKALGAEVCVFGDIDIEAHLQWGRNVCRMAGLEACFPLWQQSRRELTEEGIALGFTSTITVVDTARLSMKHLGRVLSGPVLDSIRSEGADVCGENGEYHTFVSDGPIFSRPVAFSLGEPMIRGGYGIVPLLEQQP